MPCPGNDGLVKCLIAALAVAVLAVSALADDPGAAVVSGFSTTCRLSKFAVTPGPYWSEATGQHTLLLRLQNDGRRACAVSGFPRVIFNDRRGRIPFLINHHGDQMILARRPRLITVRPGDAVWVALDKYRCDRGGTRAPTTLLISSVAGNAARFAFKRTMPFAYRTPDYCGEGDPGSIITVSPFAATPRNAMGRG
jgi:hypothetical protein